VKDLTERQAEVLQFICDHINEEGWPPTMREIMAYFGFASTNAANDHLRALERKGFIRTDPMKSRAIRVLQDHRGRVRA